MLPEVFWDTNDDLCDCTYQRIGFWTNPYLGETLEVRWCCVWGEILKDFPQYTRTTRASMDYNRHEWVTDVAEWDGESDMPRSIWYRQLARQHGITVAEARARYAHLDPPKGTPLPRKEDDAVDPVQALLAMVTHLAGRVVALEKENSDGR